MALLNEAVFREKLSKLTSTQQSVENTSAWCQFHRADARRVAEVWEDFFSRADQPKRLSMVYLANDIIQNGRKKGPEFLSEFYKVLPRALRHMMGKADDKTRTALNKVIRVWDERKVFGSSGLKTFYELVHDLPSPAAGARGPLAAGAGATQQQQQQQQQQGAAAVAAVAGGAAPAHPAMAQLGDALTTAAGAAARSAQLAGVVAVAVPQALAAGPGSGVQQVGAARQAVQGLMSALQSEAGSRQAAAALLRQLLGEQEGGAAAAASQLQACSQQLAQLDARLAEAQAAAAAAAGAAAGVQQAPAPAAQGPAGPWGMAQQQRQPAVVAMSLGQEQSVQAPPVAAQQAPPPPAPALPQPPALPSQQAPPPPQQEAQQPAADPASEAASIAAALTQNQNSAEALLAAFMALPQDQQDGLGAELAGLLQQPVGGGGPGGGGAGGELEGVDDLFGGEEYNPEEF